MNVLIACEESQAVCKAFRARGHRAFSADIQECSGGHPEWHILGDVLPLLNGNCNFILQNRERERQDGRWDLIIAHPPCTYLSNAGACRLYKRIDGKSYLEETRLNKGFDAKEFFMKFYNADCEMIAIENPVPSKIYRLPTPSQAIQPYEYGHPYTKKTYLWLKGLPPLIPTNVVKPKGGWVCGNSEIWKKQAAQGEVVGKEKSAKHRSKTFSGIAEAMAEQWGTIDETFTKKQLSFF
jgi:hypothetical protein